MVDLHQLRRREGMERVNRVLVDCFGLEEAADRPVIDLLGRDAAPAGPGHDAARPGPRILFLDEPTTGLDPRSRRQVWDDIRSLVAGGVTVFLTTQYLEEADALADRIALLDGGRLVAEGTAAELKALVPGGQVRLDFAEPGALAAASDRARRVECRGG